jgi:hypothetical protein
VVLENKEVLVLGNLKGDLWCKLKKIPQIKEGPP